MKSRRTRAYFQLAVSEGHFPFRLPVPSAGVPLAGFAAWVHTEGLTMMHMKTLAAAATVASGLAFGASAAPLTPMAGDTINGAALIGNVAFGCGPGFAPGPFGRCRPILRRRFYGPRCVIRLTPVGPRRICRY